MSQVSFQVAFMFDPTTNPKRIYFNHPALWKPCIYSVDGDTLKICYGNDARPKEWPGAENFEQTVMEFRRIQK